MPGDYAVNGLHISDVSTVDSNLVPIVKHRLTFYVGKRGPFIHDYTTADYSADGVTQRVRAEVERLKAIDTAVASI